MRLSERGLPLATLFRDGTLSRNSNRVTIISHHNVSWTKEMTRQLMLASSGRPFVMLGQTEVWNTLQSESNHVIRVLGPDGGDYLSWWQVTLTTETGDQFHCGWQVVS